MKDDSGSYAVFTEQGSSASQMTAAKVMDIISRLPGCDGQAADAVSAYTQVKMEDARKIIENSKNRNVQTFGSVYHDTKWPKIMVQYGRPSRSSCKESVRSSFGKIPTRASGKPHAEIISSWSYDMEGHAKRCVERYCELANKTTQQLYKVATPCMDDHQFEEEENESVGELSTDCSQIVLKCLYLARIMVCERTCSCGHKMDEGLRQTLGSFDFLHSSHM